MARTKQTVRRVQPTHDDVAAALVVSSVPMAHALTPPTPALSAKRCQFAIDWSRGTFGNHYFVEPVNWQQLGLTDYPVKISHPMDLATLREYATSPSFCFATFLDRSRVIWACGIFELEAPLLRYIEDKLHNLPTRVAEGPSKFTLERLDELEKQVAHVGRMQEKIARSVRRESPDDPKRRLVVRSTRMADEPSNGVRYVGTMQDGSHVYEKLRGGQDQGGALKRSRFFHQGPLVWK